MVTHDFKSDLSLIIFVIFIHCKFFFTKFIDICIYVYVMFLCSACSKVPHLAISGHFMVIFLTSLLAEMCYSLLDEKNMSFSCGLS